MTADQKPPFDYDDKAESKGLQQAFRETLEHRLATTPIGAVEMAVAFMNETDKTGLPAGVGFTVGLLVEVLLPWMQDSSNEYALIAVPGSYVLRSWLAERGVMMDKAAALGQHSAVEAWRTPVAVDCTVMPNERLLEVIACALHQQNKVYCNSLRDYSQVPWSEAPDNIKASAIDGVKKALTGATREQSHENWCRFKVEDGWVYGPVKDLAAKTHPSLVPYGDLTEDEKYKDELFITMVHQLAAVLGWSIPETNIA